MQPDPPIQKPYLRLALLASVAAVVSSALLSSAPQDQPQRADARRGLQWALSSEGTIINEVITTSDFRFRSEPRPDLAEEWAAGLRAVGLSPADGMWGDPRTPRTALCAYEGAREDLVAVKWCLVGPASRIDGTSFRGVSPDRLVYHRLDRFEADARVGGVISLKHIVFMSTGALVALEVPSKEAVGEAAWAKWGGSGYAASKAFDEAVQAARK